MGEDEHPDEDIAERAMATFGKASPKCALLHFVDDKMRTANSITDPLLDADLVLAYQRENHIQTIKTFHMMSTYGKWNSAFKATSFVVCPHTLKLFSDDLAQCSAAVQRSVATNRMMNAEDWTGFSLVLQLLDDSKENGEKIHSSVKFLTDLPISKKRALSGKILPLK